MVAARKPARLVPEPPPRQAGALVHGNEEITDWLDYYWHKLQLPTQELSHLAITQERREFSRWTGKRLNVMALGCYCYLPAPVASRRSLLAHLPGSSEFRVPGHHHLIFIEPGMQPQAIEVTVAHELIHLADRVHGSASRSGRRGAVTVGKCRLGICQG